MGNVERLLTAALVEIVVIDPADERGILREYYSELDRRFDIGFDPAQTLPLDLDEMRPPGVFLVALLHDEPVACGVLKVRPRKATEVKRMWVSASVRGLGVGRRLLGELEVRAAANGSRKVRLDTNGTLTEAIVMYRSSGYRGRSPRSTNEPYATLWFEKRLERDMSGQPRPGNSDAMSLMTPASKGSDVD